MGMPDALPSIVQIRNLSKAYQRGGQVVPVLTDINLDVDRGQFVALMGPSGSGKSTLLNLIAGIDKPDGGSLRVNGLDISALSEAQLADWRAANVGFIFQFYNLLPVLTAFENVELPLLLTQLSRRERREHAEAALSMVGLADRSSIILPLPAASSSVSRSPAPITAPPFWSQTSRPATDRVSGADILKPWIG
jgi:putative ABC transport system ATP-binding protein